MLCTAQIFGTCELQLYTLTWHMISLNVIFTRRFEWLFNTFLQIGLITVFFYFWLVVVVVVVSESPAFRSVLFVCRCEGKSTIMDLYTLRRIPLKSENQLRIFGNIWDCGWKKGNLNSSIPNGTHIEYCQWLKVEKTHKISEFIGGPFDFQMLS